MERSSLFQNTRQSAIAEVARQSSRAAFERRSTLHRQGEKGTVVHVIGSGRARLLRKARDGRELTLAYRGSGSLLGEDVLVDGSFHAEVRATEHLETVLIPVRVLKGVFRATPEVGIALLQTVLGDMIRCERRIEALLTRPVEARIAHFLSEAVERHGIPDSRGQLISVKFTHLEIAGYVGSTRETVTLVLGDLKRRGIISVDHRRVVVLHLDQLRSLI